MKRVIQLTKVPLVLAYFFNLKPLDYQFVTVAYSTEFYIELQYLTQGSNRNIVGIHIH